MSALFFRLAFSDFESLADLERGDVPEVDLLKRRLFVLERRHDVRKPDHFYRNYLQARFGGLRDISDMPGVVLDAMVDRFLTVADGRVVVREEAFADWQSAIGSLSPLAMVVRALWKDPPWPPECVSDLTHELQKAIGATACVGPLIPDLETMVDAEGLHDLHMHLNGSTEVDLIWIDAVHAPDEYKVEFEATYTTFEPVKELYEQIEGGLSAAKLHGRLRAARRARHLIASEIARRRQGQPLQLVRGDLLKAFELDRADNEAIDAGTSYVSSPYLTLQPRCQASPLMLEGGFLLACMQAVTEFPELSEHIGLMLWHNFTVFSQISRLAVQQFSQTGFDQFNKAVLAGSREKLERSYEARFHQLQGNSIAGDLSHLDGRFAPKSTREKTGDLILRAVDGLLRYRKCPQRMALWDGDLPDCLEGPCGCPDRSDRLDLGLVAHFVKRPDEPPRDVSSGELTLAHGRHISLRATLAAQAEALKNVLDASCLARAVVRGLDGAGNELDTPPEVFAPTFRGLRAHGVSQATFHVGEDFEHLVSGIRAVAEALRFLEFKAGDRVGHAIALGLDPTRWMDRIGERATMRRENVLDDAVYALALIEDGLTLDGAAALQAWVAEHSLAVYGEKIAPATLHAAWTMRGLDFRCVKALEDTFAGDPLADIDEFGSHVLRAADHALDSGDAREILRVADSIASNPGAYRVFRLRHTPNVRERGAELIEMQIRVADTAGVPYTRKSLRIMQGYGLDKLRDAGVIIEALPTSNVRIGAYREYLEHHILWWMGYGVDQLAEKPSVCLGSDDPGIFSTNIRNEYGHILIALRSAGARSPIQDVRNLNESGRRARFKKIALNAGSCL